MERITYQPFEKESTQIELTEAEKYRYSQLILRAKEAKAYPDQSGFYVKTAGQAADGTEYLGGNKEYGFSDAFIHGETAVVSGLLDATASPIEVIAWYVPEGERVTAHHFGCPCGNCRDVMNRYCSPDLTLLNGNETGVVVTHLKDYLFKDFRRTDLRNISEVGLDGAIEAAHKAIDVYLPEELKGKMYGAALVSADGTVWRGSHYTNAGYDSVTPMLSAVLNWLNDYPVGRVSEKHFNIEHLVIAGGEEMVDPFYRDRQAVLELDEVLRKYRGDSKPLRVEVVKIGGDVDAFETNVEEWLPHPFSPGAFGMESALEGQIKKLVGE